MGKVFLFLFFQKKKCFPPATTSFPVDETARGINFRLPETP